MHYCSKFKLVLIFGFLPTLDNKLIKAKWLETTDAKVNRILYNVSKLSSSLKNSRREIMCFLFYYAIKQIYEIIRVYLYR